MNRSIFILILFFIGLGSLSGQNVQDTVSLEKPQIKVIARAQQDRILLRWGVDTPLAWRQLNGSGYTIERYTIVRNGTTLAEPEKNVLTKAPLKPEPLEEWMDIIESNDNAAIVAQALYGESFEVTGGSDIESIVSLSEDLQQRFTFTLYTADQDFDVAQKAALGYVDRTAKTNEKYVYRVISNVPKERADIQYGGVFVGISDYQPLPKPLDLAGVFNDSNVILSWNFKIMNKTYNSYNVERSSNGTTFNRINETPYTILGQENGNGGRIFYIDSITNNQNYTYRVQGITPFGEEGPYSDVISGEGKEVLKFVPHLTIKEILDENRVKLTWEFPQEGNKHISGFELNRSNGRGELLEVLIKEIPPTARTVVYDKLAPSNYFTLTAVGKNNNRRSSFPMLVQPVDSIPPVRPVGLGGEVDSLGVVNISWTANKENDLLGYRVYRGNKKSEEFSQITVDPIAPNSFVDTVKVENLNSKVFYKVIAVDRRYNMSKSSDILELKKPDLIPPTSPVFNKYQLKDGKIDLQWAQSSSDDVAKQMIYRKTNDDKEWQLVLDTVEKVETFSDENIEQGNMYSYTILAMDDSGLESLPSPSVSVVVPKTSPDEKVRGFYAQVDKANKAILLSWRFKGDDAAEFEIYKSKVGEKLRLLRVVPADAKRLYDYDLTINTEYQYAIRAIFKDGGVSKTEMKKVKY